jgi:hypothetical protein
MRMGALAHSVVAPSCNNKSAIAAYRTSQAVSPADLWVHGLALPDVPKFVSELAAISHELRKGLALFPAVQLQRQPVHGAGDVTPLR